MPVRIDPVSTTLRRVARALPHYQPRLSSQSLRVGNLIQIIAADVATCDERGGYWIAAAAWTQLKTELCYPHHGTHGSRLTRDWMNRHATPRVVELLDQAAYERDQQWWD